MKLATPAISVQQHLNSQLGLPSHNTQVRGHYLHGNLPAVGLLMYGWATISWLRYTVISPWYKIPGYFWELSSGKYTAQFKNFTTARMHWHMYGFQWHFGVIFPSQDTMWSIILFTMYYFTAINIFLFLHYTEILNSIIIPSIPYQTRQARTESFTESHPILRKDKYSQQTLTYDRK